MKDILLKLLRALATVLAVVISLAAALLILLPLFFKKGVNPFPMVQPWEEDPQSPILRFLDDGEEAASANAVTVKKRYWIPEGTKLAPKPNPECYGQTDDPSSLGWLIEEAQELLEGQDLYFSTDVEIFPGSQVRYYLDDSIFVIVWKRLIDFGVYTFAEVKIADPSQFRRYIADDDYCSPNLYVTTEMSERVNAVLGSSGDFFANRWPGIVVYNGVAERVHCGELDTCYIDKNGDLIFARRNVYMTEAEAQEYVDENDILFSLAFGPVLIENGEIHLPSSYYVGENSDHFPRAAIGQRDKLHYIVADVNAEGGHWWTPTLQGFAKVFIETGCPNAYTLDGGQTNVITLGGEMINSVMKGFQRPISDIFYFATAVPSH